MSESFSFEERAQRVLARPGRGALLIGPDEQLILPERSLSALRKPQQVAGAGSTLYALAGALGIGVLSFVLGCYALFSIMGGKVEAAFGLLELLALSGVGLLIGLATTWLFKMSSFACRAMLCLGVLVATCSFHNLFHWLPGPAAKVFSPGFVAQVRQTAPANSIQFYGTVVAFGQTTAATAQIETAPFAQTGCSPAATVAERKESDGARWLTAPERQSCE